MDQKTKALQTVRKLIRAHGFTIPMIRSGDPADGIDASGLPDVDVVFDVGVAYGTAWLYNRYPKAEMHLFDPLPPDDKLKAALAKRKVKYYQVALGETEGSLTFHHNVDAPSRSSLLERTKLTATNHAYEEIEVPVRTLDDIVAPQDQLSDATIGLKIDTEGYELQVLKGAVKTLKNCAFVTCEASVKERFVGSYKMEDLIIFMAEQGFTVNSVMTANRDVNGVCRYVDLSFVRKELAA